MSSIAGKVPGTLTIYGAAMLLANTLSVSGAAEEGFSLSVFRALCPTLAEPYGDSERPIDDKVAEVVAIIEARGWINPAVHPEGILQTCKDMLWRALAGDLTIRG